MSNPRILTVPANLKAPLNLILIHAEQTNIRFVNKFRLFYPMLTSTFLTLQLSVYPTLHINLSHSLLLYPILLLAVTPNFRITTGSYWPPFYSDIMYPYISDNIWIILIIFFTVMTQFCDFTSPSLNALYLLAWVRGSSHPVYFFPLLEFFPPIPISC
jgi:hypothetical protein